jgi:SNF2 family DNA or RNA helicase
VSLNLPLYADHWNFARYLAKNSPKLIISGFNNPHSHLDALLLSIKFSGADLNLHWNCSDIIIACVAENINMVLQALGRTHHIGQLRSQRVWIITQDHSYDQLLQAAQTKKILRRIISEEWIKLNVNFEFNDGQIMNETVNIIDNKKQQKADELWRAALLRKDRAIQVQSEEIIVCMMGQRCSRLNWACQKDPKLKDKVEQVHATLAKTKY